MDADGALTGSYAPLPPMGTDAVAPGAARRKKAQPKTAEGKGGANVVIMLIIDSLDVIKGDLILSSSHSSVCQTLVCTIERLSHLGRRIDWRDLACIPYLALRPSLSPCIHT